MAKPVVIFGAGEMAHIARRYFADDSSIDVVGLTVNASHMAMVGPQPLPLIPFESLLSACPADQVDLFVAIGYSEMNRVRARVFNECRQLGYQLVSYVSTRAYIAPGVKMGANCFILESNVVQYDVAIGDDVLLWSGNHIGHGTSIGDHCYVASHAVIAGHVRVEPFCFLGINATIRDGITVARGSLVGAGAVILKDTQPEGVYAVKGTEPAKVLSSQLRRI